MKRICVFAHWDKDNIIDDYVIYYLNALKEVTDAIIFVSDCNLNDIEIQKLSSITEHIIAAKHGEYDFGSYKRGFLYAKSHNMYFEELIFANDSCYGPFYSLKSIFEKMKKKKCDFWGLTENYCGIKKNNDKLYELYLPHIQSYFIVFKSQVFNNFVFSKFINNIKRCDKKEDIIIQYEQGLNLILRKSGFIGKSYINTFFNYSNLVGFHWDDIIEKHNFPFLKTSIAKNGLLFWGKQYGYIEIIKKRYDYPIEMITKNVNRLQKQEAFSINELSKIERFLCVIQRKYPTEFFLILKFFVRKIVYSIRRFIRYIRQNF